MNKKITYCILIFLIFLSQSIVGKSNILPKKMISLYPSINENFWSFLKGTEIEVLTKKNENTYHIWSFLVGFSNVSCSQVELSDIPEGQTCLFRLAPF